jgi:hypothetical protein
MTKSAVDEAERMVVTRVFDAPRELVWKAWTDGGVLGEERGGAERGGGGVKLEHEEWVLVQRGYRYDTPD